MKNAMFDKATQANYIIDLECSIISTNNNISYVRKITELYGKHMAKNEPERQRILKVDLQGKSKILKPEEYRLVKEYLEQIDNHYNELNGSIDTHNKLISEIRGYIDNPGSRKKAATSILERSTKLKGMFDKFDNIPAIGSELRKILPDLPHDVQRYLINVELEATLLYRKHGELLYKANKNYSAINNYEKNGEYTGPNHLRHISNFERDMVELNANISRLNEELNSKEMTEFERVEHNRTLDTRKKVFNLKTSYINLANKVVKDIDNYENSNKVISGLDNNITFGVVNKNDFIGFLENKLIDCVVIFNTTDADAAYAKTEEINNTIKSAPLFVKISM